MADIGINLFTKEQYSGEFTSGMCTVNVSGGLFYDGVRIGCIVRMILVLKDKKELILNCLENCGLLYGYKDVATYFPPTLFNYAVLLRVTNLTKVNTSYIPVVLSLPNLADMCGVQATIAETMAKDQRKLLGSLCQAGTGFSKFYFALGQPSGTIVGDEENSSSGNVLHNGVRKILS